MSSQTSAPALLVSLQTTVKDDQYSILCDGCDIDCQDCTFKGAIPICTEVLGHTDSRGGKATLETLELDKGYYWRATNTSKRILKCLNGEACPGGVTGCCSEGYEGPCE